MGVFGLCVLLGEPSNADVSDRLLYTLPHVSPRMDGAREKWQAARQKVGSKIESIRSVPSEMMASGIWNSCADNVAKQFAIGATTGLALSLVLFRTSCGPAVALFVIFTCLFPTLRALLQGGLRCEALLWALVAAWVRASASSVAMPALLNYKLAVKRRLLLVKTRSVRG